MVQIIARRMFVGLVLVLAVLGCNKGGGVKSGAGGADGAVNAAGGSSSGGTGVDATADGGMVTADAGVGGRRFDSADAGITSGGAAGHRPTSGNGGLATGGATGFAGAGGASGTGEASLALDKSRLDFDSLALGATVVETFTLTNRGGSTSGIPSINVSPIRGSSASAVAAKGCTAALAPGASCTLTVTVTPTMLGLLESFVQISADPGTRGNGSSHISLLVVGWVVGFEVSSPTSIDLGTLAAGTRVQRSMTVSALIDLSDLTVKASGDSLSIDTTASTCTATLAKGASCVVVLGFNAPTVGWKEGALGFRAGGDLGQNVIIRVTANVSNANDLAVAPKAPAPFVCVFEKASPPVVFTITNVGSVPSGTVVATLTSGAVRDFRISDSNCTTLAPQATCTVSVVCAPPMSASAETRKAILSITDGNTHLAVPVSGEVTML